MNNARNNPDQFTGEEGSHPVATGLDAAAGGAAAAGAGIGAAAGPAGVAAGAAGGAILGGLAGHAAGESVNPSDIRGFVGKPVIDMDGKKIGTVDNIWEDHTGQPAFLGVKTGWLGMGKQHIVPAYSAQTHSSGKNIKVPFSGDVVKNAPAFDTQTDIDDAVEDDIYDYYSAQGIDWDRGTDTSYVPSPEEDGETKMTLKEEELKVGKRRVEDGGVRLRKIVRTKDVHEPVDLEHEEVVIERVPAGTEGVQDGRQFDETDIFIPLRHEEPVVEKRIYNREEVKLKKKTRTERRDITDTVRQEDVEVENRRNAG